MGAPIGRIVPKYSTDPAEAASHLAYCQKEARKQLKEQMKIHNVARDTMYIAALANHHHTRTKNTEKVEKLKEEMKNFLQQKVKQMNPNPLQVEPAKLVSPEQAEQEEENFKTISAKVMNDFCVNLSKNPKTNPRPEIMFQVFAVKDYGDLRKFIDGFSG